MTECSHTQAGSGLTTAGVNDQGLTRLDIFKGHTAKHAHQLTKDRLHSMHAASDVKIQPMHATYTSRTKTTLQHAEPYQAAILPDMQSWLLAPCLLWPPWQPWAAWPLEAD